MKTAGKDLEYTTTLRKTFGKKGFNLGMCAFIGILTVPLILFFQLLAQFLYPVLLVIIEIFTKEDKPITVSAEMNFSEFSYTWTCFIIFAILFTVALKRDLTMNGTRLTDMKGVEMAAYSAEAVTDGTGGFGESTGIPVPANSKSGLMAS